MENEEYVKVINREHTYTNHPLHEQYGCINFTHGEMPHNGSICKIIKRIMINENLPNYAGEPGASIDFKGHHYVMNENGFTSATREEYNDQLQPQELIQQQINQPEIKIEQKMKVKCINQSNYKDITIGNEYEVVETLENFYQIIANSGGVRSYNQKYFEVIPEPIIEDVDEVGVVEEEDEITITFDGEGDINYDINGNEQSLVFYEVASNCGVKSYHGVNYLFENCDNNPELFKKVIETIIEAVIERYNSCMLIFSTNSSYRDIWPVLDEVMDFSSEEVENPNSDMDVKLWIKYTN